MGLLSIFGFLKKEDNIEKEIETLKRVVEEQDSQGVQDLKNDVHAIFLEIQSLKMDIKKLESDREKEELKITKVAERIVKMDNDMLKVVYRDELDLVKNDINFIKEDLKTIKEGQNQVTEKIIDFALSKKSVLPQIDRFEKECLTEFEQELLQKYDKAITSEKIVMETGLSKGHISRTLKELYKKGHLTRKRKGKEYVYEKQ
ncbi:MAG: helix-turn-helix transcriptional regulator [Candidatus Methanofastidiosia archaeon]